MNSPFDICALILYDIHQWKTADKSYSNYRKLCEVLRKEAISNEDYENVFNTHSKEAYYSKNSSRSLALEDIRGCILSNVHNGKSAEKSIDDLCDAFKDHKIDKEDHDYWYTRFTNGHLFNQVTFSDFPEDVIAEIVGKCDLRTHLELRDVSYRLRTIVEQKTPTCTDIYLDFRKDGIDILTQYKCSLQKLTLRELGFLLRNPKLRLRTFDIETDIPADRVQIQLGNETVSAPRRDKTRLLNLFNSLDHQIHVENCSIRAETEEELMGVLQCFKPGTLQKIAIREGLRGHNISGIAEMVQWKHAKHLRLVAFNLPSIEHFLHFTTIKVSYGEFSTEDLVQICDGMSKSINFESYTLGTIGRLDTEAIEEALNLQQTISPGIYSIPNSNLVVEFVIDAHVMKLSKYSV